VTGSLENVRLRSGAKRWQKMVLARTRHLKDKSPLDSIDSADPSDLFF